MVRRKIVINEGVKCPDCGSNNLVGQGTYWRVNRNGDNPHKVKVQNLRCNDCGRIFKDGEVSNECNQ